MHPPVRFKENNPLNNNRGSNRRRGRGNNRQQGGNQGNRIDSRARGNAPQLLEKYKKLAHDASLNGDRVQAEYYLQFADHYFRVLADSRQQKDEQRPRHHGDRDAAYDDDEGGDEEQGVRARDTRRERNGDGRRDSAERDDAEGVDGEEFEPAENPFTRDNRGRRSEGERPSRGRSRSSDDEPREQDRDESGDGDDDDAPRFDPSSLPPSFSSDAEEDRPRRKPRKPRAAKSEDRGDEELETVN